MSLIGLVHSTRLVVEPVQQALAKQCPEFEFIHIMDEGILRQLAAVGRITKEIEQWLTNMVSSAEKTGAQIVVVSCSSLSPGVNRVRKQVTIPVIKIDEPMVEHAVENFNRIGLVMTNPTTEAPSTLLFREVSNRLGKKAELFPHLCPDAFGKLNRGDTEGHDMEVLQTVESLLQETDVVMLAQISIARVMEQMDPAIKQRVFSSLEFIGPKINAMLAPTG